MKTTDNPTAEPSQGCKPTSDPIRVRGELPTLLIVGDTPTSSTGFARVVQNLARRWRPHFSRIDIWGIGSTGWPPSGVYSEWRQHDIFPAPCPWAVPDKLSGLLRLIESGRYSHVWIIQDTFLLVANNFPNMLTLALDGAAQRTGFRPRSLLYFPVDAPLDPRWTEILECVDVPVAYTEYGKSEAERALTAFRKSHRGLSGPTCEREIKVIPHGVDTSIYRPLENRDELRSKVFSKGCSEGKMVMINVNSNSRRKGLVQSFEVLAILRRELNVPAHLYMHMPVYNANEGIDLRDIGSQFGFEHNIDWSDGSHFFKNGMHGAAVVSEQTLNTLYNAADCLITTTLGEGWGLSITEAAAAGLPVFVPDHTSCGEISRRLQSCGFDPVRRIPCERAKHVDMLDNSRVRRPVDSNQMAGSIAAWWHTSRNKHRIGLRSIYPARQWLDWDRIAHEWLDLMRVG